MPIYMKFEGIVGSATGKYSGWIQLESCQIGTPRRINSGSAGSDKPTISEIVITKRQDTSSTALFREAIAGKGRKVTIDFVNADGSAYLTLELEGTLISNVSMSQGGSAAMESLSLNFTKMSYSTKPAAHAQDADPINMQSAWSAVGP